MTTFEIKDNRDGTYDVRKHDSQEGCVTIVIHLLRGVPEEQLEAFFWGIDLASSDGGYKPETLDTYRRAFQKLFGYRPD